MGIVNLVNVQPNKILQLSTKAEEVESTITLDHLQDVYMREESYFNINVDPTFVATRFPLRENQERTRMRVPDNTYWARTMLEPLYPYDISLNLDIIDFHNVETLVDEWIANMKITATTLELDKENFVCLLELSWKDQ